MRPSRIAEIGWSLDFPIIEIVVVRIPVSGEVEPVVPERSRNMKIVYNPGTVSAVGVVAPPSLDLGLQGAGISSGVSYIRSRTGCLCRHLVQANQEEKESNRQSGSVPHGRPPVRASSACTVASDARVTGTTVLTILQRIKMWPRDAP